MDIAYLYEKLRDRLMAEPSLGIKHFALDADYTTGEDQDDSDTIAYPAITLRAQPIDESSLGNGTQLTKVEFSLEVTSEVYAEASSREPLIIQQNALAHKGLLALVNARVHRWGTVGIGTIGKQGTVIGSVASNLVQDTLNYRCTMKDVSATIQMITKSNVSIVTINKIVVPEVVLPPNNKYPYTYPFKLK